jgi:hypothetical protein
MPHPRIRLREGLLLALISAAFSAAAADPSPAQATVDGPGGVRLRVEALDPHVVRVWIKPSGDFSRKPSLAMEVAPDASSPMTVTQGVTDVIAGT